VCYALIRHLEHVVKHFKQRIAKEIPLACNVATISRTEAMKHVLQIITYMVVEKGMEHKGKL